MVDVDYGVSGVYVINRDDSNEAYIGSSVDIRQRILEHFRKLRSGSHTNQRLQNIYDSGAMFSVSVLDLCDREVLRTVESARILSYLDTYGRRCLLNASLNTQCAFDDPDVRSKILSGPNRSKSIEALRKSSSDEGFKTRRSERQKELWKDAEYRAKHTKRLYDYWNTEERRGLLSESARKSLSEPVRCLETDQIFPSLTAATNWLRDNGHPKASATALSAIFTGKGRYSAYGYRWVKVSSDNPTMPPKYATRIKPVIMIPDNIRFESVGSAVRYLKSLGKNASTTAISGCCSGKRKSCYGKQWVYDLTEQSGCVTQLKLEN